MRSAQGKEDAGDHRSAHFQRGETGVAMLVDLNVPYFANSDELRKTILLMPECESNLNFGIRVDSYLSLHASASEI